jgi:8-oxo-dGTP pyrophosphatase MutT (NUDIX family)
MDRFVKRMNEVERDLTSTCAAESAATLILVDRTGRVPKVLLGKRHARHKFPPGKFVFPGGRVDAADRHMRWRGPSTISQPDEAPATGERRQGTRVCARSDPRRSETGLLLGVRSDGLKLNGPWTAFADGGSPRSRRVAFHRRAITPADERGGSTRASSPWTRARRYRIEGVTGPDAGGRAHLDAACRRPAARTCRRSPA